MGFDQYMFMFSGPQVFLLILGTVASFSSGVFFIAISSSGKECWYVVLPLILIVLTTIFFKLVGLDTMQINIWGGASFCVGLILALLATLLEPAFSK